MKKIDEYHERLEEDQVHSLLLKESVGSMKDCYFVHQEIGKKMTVQPYFDGIETIMEWSLY